MEFVTRKNLLKLTPNAIEEIRKIHNLHKPGRMEEAIDLLEGWLKKQDHILKKDFSRSYLETTLICAKGSVEKAKKVLDKLCTMKTLLPNFFTKSNVNLELKEILDLVCIILLPIQTMDFYRIMVIKINSNAITENVIFESYQYCMILLEYAKAHDYFNGFLLIYDFQDVNIFDLVSKLNPVLLQQFISIVLEGYGSRIKSICLLTQSKAIDLFVKLIKQFIGQKIANRIYIVKTVQELHEIVPKDNLPVEYGGNERSNKEFFADWIQEFSTNEHVEYMKIMNKACTDESLRKSNEFIDEYMGTPGSFRNISVD